jgi:enterobactin synthetase component D
MEKFITEGHGLVPGLQRHERRTIPEGALHLLAFDQAQFDVRTFAQLQLAMPDNIARSVRRRQAEFLFGRLAARLALAEHGQAGCHVAVGPNRAPVWPAGFIGSITHSGQHAAAVAFPCGSLHGIGIDIETAVAPDACAGVEQVVLLPSEQALLRKMRDYPYPLLLAAVFSAKESFYKAVSAAAGGFFGFEVMRITEIDVAAGRILFTLEQTVCPEWQQGKGGEVGLAVLDSDLILTHFRW